MSEELHKQIKDLIAQNENLNKQIVQHNAGIEGLLSQIDAHREQINESVTSGLNAKANAAHLKKQNNRVINQVGELQKHIDELNKQLEAANKKIAELENNKKK